LAESSTAFTLIHHSSFMQNFLVEAIRTRLKFSLPLHADTNVAWLDVEDYSQSIAEGFYLLFVYLFIILFYFILFYFVLFYLLLIIMLLFVFIYYFAFKIDSLYFTPFFF